MAAESSVPECEEKEPVVSDVQEGDGNGTVSSAEHEDDRKEAVSSAEQEDDRKEAVSSAEHVDDMKEAVSSAEKEDDKLKEEFPAENVDGMKGIVIAAAQEVGNTLEAVNPAETCNELESSRNKKSKVLRVKRKIVKKSPASRILKTKKVQGKQEDNKKEKEVPAAQEVMEIVEAENSTEKCSKSESITKKNSNVLKVKKKLVKKSPASSLLKTDKVQSSPKIQARKKPTNDKSVLQANGKSREKNAEDSKKQKEKNISKEEHIQKSEEAHASQNDISELKSSLQEKKNVEKGGHSDKSLKNQKHREKDNVEKSPRENKHKENFGGFIFMCSTKTKPDCLHYNVMGVSASKKDSVLAIKPGIKLFLYDFDLRLLYGIYKASSSGGMKLEPKAFNGAFPAQVRFKIHKDCFPLPENVFKKAIKENFYEKHKFRAELTAEQVRKLSDLFRPIGIHSSSATVRSSPRAPIRDRKARGGVKEVRTRNPKSEGDGKNYHSSSRKRDREVPYREEVPRHREEASSRDLYLSEKEYRTYGLRAERRNLDSVPYHRDYDRDYHLRLPESSYRDVVPAQRELVRADHVYFNGKDYPVYTIDPRPELSPPKAIPSGSERNAYDPYYNRQYVPPVDPYLLPSRREERVPPNYSGRNYVVDTEPVRHAVDALSYYNQTHHTKLESDTMPVSSRYSFAGPSYTYR